VIFFAAFGNLANDLIIQFGLSGNRGNMLMMDKLASPKFKSKTDFSVRNLRSAIKGSVWDLGNHQSILGQCLIVLP